MLSIVEKHIEHGQSLKARLRLQTFVTFRSAKFVGVKILGRVHRRVASSGEKVDNFFHGDKGEEKKLLEFSSLGEAFRCAN